MPAVVEPLGGLLVTLLALGGIWWLRTCPEHPKAAPGDTAASSRTDEVSTEDAPTAVLDCATGPIVARRVDDPVAVITPSYVGVNLGTRQVPR